MRSLYFLVLLILFSCAENDSGEETCVECSERNLVDTVRNVYFQIESDRDPVVLLKIDSVEESSSLLLPCDQKLLENRGETKILRGSYYLYETCDTSKVWPQISIFDYEFVETCFPRLDTTDTEASLYGYWWPYDITIAGQTDYKPCELPAVLIIEEGEPYDVLIFRTGGGISNDVIITSDSMSLVSSTATLESLPTSEGETFRTNYCKALNCSLSGYKPTLSYQLTNNFLSLHNQKSNAIIRFYRPD